MAEVIVRTTSGAKHTFDLEVNAEEAYALLTERVSCLADTDDNFVVIHPDRVESVTLVKGAAQDG